MSGHTSLRRRAITGIAAVASAITLSAGSSISSPGPLATAESVLHVPSATDANTSPNWAGAVHTSTTDGTFQGVSGTWQVPTVSGSDGYSCTWVGIDGYGGDENLIQTGTEEDVVDGQPTYYAWMEILPAEPTEQKILASDGSLEPVQPGDAMWAYVGQTEDPTVWAVHLQDWTQNWTFDQTFTYDGPGRSAEWIQEGTSEGGVVQAPANFGEVTISNTYEVANGQLLAAQVSHGDLLAQELDNHLYAVPDETIGSGQQYVTVRYNSL